MIGESAFQAVAFTAASAAGTGPQPGSRFGGYDIVRLLGQGGMGMVFEAEQVETGRRVALKVLNHALDLPEARKRFLREGRLAASVSHPNLVYIFGTEEIDGSLVIAMELVTGGTLKERINRDGPLPVKEAVDVCLQLIAGLEVAAAAGVLHRDIKPANCFVDSDGVVKVGDFGLSISTLARAETQLTTSGAFLGTPTFSSPEQLRGDALDVRSDIYAVGVTLYYLLTGKTPFEGDNFVKLLATVLEKAPESPTRLRREIPRGLAKAVLRCLAKKPGQRFKGYTELRAALQPFASSTQRPASLNLRGGAGFVDTFIVTGAILGFFSLASAGHPLLRPWGSSSSLVGLAVQYIIAIAYYSILEGVWAATPGKAICKLRLVRVDGGKATLPDALNRAFWFMIPPAIPVFLAPVLYGFQIGRGHEPFISSFALFASLVIFGLLFVSVRKRNGYAGLHDLWSRTRVITLARPEGQRVWIQPPGEAIPEGELPFKIGPYNSVQPLDQAADFQLFAGYDQKLLRKVWLQKMPAGAPPVSPDRQKLSRATRVRWIGGRRSTEENWDAYERVSGRPLLSSQATSASWSHVRYWLLDLAEELEAGPRTQTMVPVLEPARVWIGTDGRVKLLDALPALTLPAEETGIPLRVGAAPSTGSEPPVFVDVQKGQLLLKQVALAALEGPAGQDDPECLRPPAVPLPLHARRFLAGLPRFPNWDALIQELKELVSRPAAVTRSTRLKGLVFLGIPWILLAAMWPVMALRGLLGAQAVISSLGLVGIAFGIFVVLPSFICAALFRGGYVAYRSGVTFVKRDGSPASRARLLWRNLLTWLPLLLVIPVAAGYTPDHKVLVKTAAALLVVVSAFGIFRCIKVPERSYADCLAGTWMVPR
jgi:uncharacterized RDD family membrane protein YckC